MGNLIKDAEKTYNLVTDIWADNANKFGTDMDSIQNAYQGFAKQNYTMLDNLKLGYGGTKEEMSRLLSDATKLTGVKYDISNLSDVYSAIHAVQGKLDITGTTAKEASSTFSGSFSAMKASTSNLLANLSTGGDVTGAMSSLVDTASTFLMGNAIPMVINVISALPSAISTGIKQASPKIKEAGGKLLERLKDGMSGSTGGIGSKIFGSIDLGGIFETIKPAISSFRGYLDTNLGALGECFVSVVGVIQNILPNIVTAVSSVFDNMAPMVDTFKNIFVSAMPVVQGIIQGVCTFITGIMPTVSSIFQVVGGAIQGVLQVIGNHMGLFQTIVQTVVTVVSTVWQALAPVIQAVVSLIITIVDGLLTGIETVFNFLAPYISQIWSSICGFFSSASSTITTVVDTLKTVFNGLNTAVATVFDAVSSKITGVCSSIAGVISGVVGAISGFIDKIGGAISKAQEFASSVAGNVGSALGFAYGKDRVPYDNYPARLHEGEKVLTRNEADQYDRMVSTRGVSSNVRSSGAVSIGNTNANDQQAERVVKVRENKQSINPNVNMNITFKDTHINNMGDLNEVVGKMANIFVKRMEKVATNMA